MTQAFSDRTLDFLASAAAIGGVLDKAWFRPIGEIVLEALQATRRVTATNTNLGIVLLLTPLASVVPGRDLRLELANVLKSLSAADAVLVYEAIRLAQPGGLGQVPEHDVADVPTITLREAMALSENRDRIAWQYTHDFADIFDLGLPALDAALTQGRDLESAVVATFRTFLSTHRDSLIERKHGPEIAERVRIMASRSDVGDDILDHELRSNRWNPGTTADLTAACLFVALREGMITLPLDRPWSSGR